MSELKKHFERLIDFAKDSNFYKPFSQVYFVEERFVRRFLDSDKSDEISTQNMFSFENYEKRFSELLHQGHSWINMNFAGMVNNTLLVIIELPNYENNIEYTAVNLSEPFKKVLDNNLSLSPFFRIV